MAFPRSKTNQHTTSDVSGLFNVAKSYSPAGDDLLLLGNTIVTPVKRTKSPASYSGGSPQLNSIISTPNHPGSPYTPRQGFDRNGTPLQGTPGLLNYGGMRPDYNGPRNPSLLAMNGRNSLSGYSPMNMNPYGNADYIPENMNLLGLNPQSPFVQPGYPRGPMSSRLDDPEVTPVVHNYLNKQNEIMSKIMRDVQEFKKLEAVKDRMLYDQQFSRMDLSSGNGMLSPYGQNLTSLQSFPPMMPVQMPMQMMQMPMQMPMQMQMPLQPFQYGQPLDQYQQMKQSPSARAPENPDEDGPPIRRDLSLNSEGNNRKNDNVRMSPKKTTLPKKANKIRGRRNLKAIVWTMALPGLWFISTVKWAEKRRAIELKILEETIPDHLEKFLEFGGEFIEKELKALVLDKNPMIIVLPPKTTIKPAEMDKRCKAISDHLVAIIDTLSINLDGGKMPKEFFQFLASLSENDAVIPENFLSGFEIDRLSFNMFGNFKRMNEWRSKMILGSFILVKGLLYFLIMRSWTVISSIPEKNVNMKNILNVGSILYNTILEIFVENIPEVQEIESEPPFKATKTTFTAVDPAFMNKLDVIPEDNETDDLHIVSGFYDRDRLMALMDDRPLMMKELKEAIIDFLDVLYELTHAAYVPKDHVKKMFKDHRPK